VLDERGDRVRFAKADVAVSSHLAVVECHRAIDRARLVGAMDDVAVAIRTKELIGFFARLALVEISSAIVNLARAPFPVPVRALDAIHVATAQWLLPQVGGIAFWTHDHRQALAALSRGLDVAGITVDASGKKPVGRAEDKRKRYRRARRGSSVR